MKLTEEQKNQIHILDEVEDTIQNGVKHTIDNPFSLNTFVEDTIQNGVKETRLQKSSNLYRIEDTIQNGVKHCEDGDRLDGDERFEDIIKNGIKEK